MYKYTGQIRCSIFLPLCPKKPIMSPSDPKGPNSQLTQEQLAVLLNLLQSKSAPAGSAQLSQAMGLKINPETLQHLAKALLPGAAEPERPPEPPALAQSQSKPPQPVSAVGGAPRTPPLPKPPSPPTPQQQGKLDGDVSATATQTAVTMLLAQFLKVQQRAEALGTEGADTTISTASGAPAAPLPAEIKQPPEPSPVSPGKATPPSGNSLYQTFKSASLSQKYFISHEILNLCHCL